MNRPKFVKEGAVAVDPECRFPIILYRNKGTDNPAAELFYRKMCEAFHT